MAAAHIGQAHSLHREGYNDQAEQWADHAKAIFFETNSDLSEDELETRYSEFQNHVLDLCYELNHEELVKEIPLEYEQVQG